MIVRPDGSEGGGAGQHSIWINDRWRICFVWTEQGPADAEIGDYHSRDER